jgi:hypothetical protein
MAAAAAAAAREAPWDGHAGSPIHHSSRHSSRPRSTSAAAASAFAVDGEDDADDAWADRLWKDMQDHKRQAAAAAKAAAYRRGSGSSRGVFGAGPSRDEAAQERERRAAAAAAESARILQEEQAKDADWRAAMKRQIEEVCYCVGAAQEMHNWVLCMPQLMQRTQNSTHGTSQHNTYRPCSTEHAAQRSGCLHLVSSLAWMMHSDEIELDMIALHSSGCLLLVSSLKQMCCDNTRRCLSV